VSIQLRQTNQPIHTASADALVLVLFSGSFVDHETFRALDKSLNGALQDAVTDEQFNGQKGQFLIFNPLGQIDAKRVILAGAGPDSPTPNSARSLCAAAVRRAAKTAKTSVSLALVTDTKISPDCVEAAAEGVCLASYRFDKYLNASKSDPPVATPNHLATVSFHIDGPDDSFAAQLVRAPATAAAVRHARDLVNEPAEVMTPRKMSEIAKELAHEAGLECTILDEDQCRSENMNLFLAVSKGSVEPPRFVHLAYKPALAKKRLVLVGKGVTFDSGGHSLKPSDGMLEMKADMAGSAAVVAVMKAIAAEAPPVEVHALTALTENMISGSAYRLGDVFRGRSGTTVEINNTDAEGRLTLADALSYAEDLKPDIIIDFATLTGACMVALGPYTAGVMSNNPEAAEAWMEAAKTTGESMWQLPLNPDLKEQLKSDIADLKNTGTRWGGALTAGLFLKEFVKQTPWIHVDIAGPATASKDRGHTTKGGTGFAVPTILAYVRALAQA